MAATDSPPPKKPLGIPRPSGARNSMTITMSVGKALADVMNNPASNPTATVPSKGKESKRLSLTNTFKKALPAPIATAPAKSGKKSPQAQAPALPSPPSSSPTFGRRTADPPVGVSPIKPKSTATPNGPVVSALPKFRPKTSGITAASKPPGFSPSRRKRRGSSDEDADQSASATDVSLNARPVSPLPRRGVAKASLLGTAVIVAASQTKTVPPIVTVIPASSVPPASNSPIKLVEPKKRKTAVPQPSASSSARSSPRSGLPLKPGTPSTSRPVSAASRTRTHSSASNHTSTSSRKPVASSSSKDKENQTRSSPVVARTPGTPKSEQRATTPRSQTTNKAGPSTPSKPQPSPGKAAVASTRKPSTVQEEPPQTHDAPDYPDTSMESIDVGEVSALLEIDHMPSPAKTFPRTGPARLRPGAAYGNIGFGSPQTPPRNLPARSALSYLSPSMPHPDDMSPSPSLRASIIEADRRSRTSILSWEQLTHSRLSTSGLDMLSNVPVPFISSTPGMTPLMTPDEEDSTLRLPGLPRQRVDSGWGPESPTPFLNNLSLSRSSSPPLTASRRTSGRPSLPRSHITSVAEDSPSIGQIMFPGSDQPAPISQRRSPPRAPATPPTEDDTAGALVALLRLQLASAEDRAQRSELENKLLSDELANRMHAEEERREALEAEMESELNGIRRAMEEEKRETERAIEGLTTELQKRTSNEEMLKAALEATERAIEEKERQIRLDQEQRMDSAEHRRIITEMRRKHDLELAMRETDEAYRTARLAIEQELELVTLWQEMTSVLGDSLTGAATIFSGQLPISV